MRCMMAALLLLLIIQTSKLGRWSHMWRWWVVMSLHVSCDKSHDSCIDHHEWLNVSVDRPWTAATKWTFVNPTPAGSSTWRSWRSRISSLLYHSCVLSVDVNPNSTTRAVVCPPGETSTVFLRRRSHGCWITFLSPFPSASSWTHESRFTSTREVYQSSRSRGPTGFLFPGI